MNKVGRLKFILFPIVIICLVASVIMLLHSVNGTHLVGCGAGSSCDNVMGSRWAYIGRLPVSAVAVVTYVVFLVCLLFLSNGKKKEDLELDNVILIIMHVLGGAILGAALWFSYIQIGILHQFCKYCTFTHVLGSIGAVYMFFKVRKSEAISSRFAFSGFFTGLLSAIAFAIAQYILVPSIVYDDGIASSKLPSYSSDELPSIGPADAEHEITLMFDFQCIHCRGLHKLLPEVIEKSGGKIRFLLCPTSLSTECNPYIPHDGIDRFVGSCTMSRLALAVWFYRPELYPQVEHYLLGGGDDRLTINPDDAIAYVSSLIGQKELDEALQYPRIKKHLSKSYEIFGRTSTSQKGGIPKLIYKQKWLVPETDSAEQLISVIQKNLIP